MNVRIGVLHTPKELDVELDTDTKIDDLEAEIESAVANGQGMLWLTDKHDRKIGVPVDRIAYVDITPKTASGRIGFGA